MAPQNEEVDQEQTKRFVAEITKDFNLKPRIGQFNAMAFDGEGEKKSEITLSSRPKFQIA